MVLEVSASSIGVHLLESTKGICGSLDLVFSKSIIPLPLLLSPSSPLPYFYDFLEFMSI